MLWPADAKTVSIAKSHKQVESEYPTTLGLFEMSALYFGPHYDRMTVLKISREYYLLRADL